MVKRKRLLLGVLIVSLIEIIYFYFMGKKFVYMNGLKEVIEIVIIGNIAFFVAYFLLLEPSNFRKKYILLIIAYALLIIAPFVYHSKMPSTTFEEAQKLIMRTEGGKVVKDRDYTTTIKTYEGNEVYLIALEKKSTVKRFAFDAENQRYYPFSN
ncbi:hypothetical protein [Kurthia sibirica]|uniref:Uncharacterized protein n=1 Tax=Kurthia sibirica TaxID=202750 RepID=A0A2U3AIM5_9BACL|nr:hypothetical protein [Kurthia sibirica]PWI24380.1 hypothetical protein DEX24_13670 [Kurthia sibirica]GEK33797.1 hypothetical protein KSI01_13300 [Kurthia sibirica]